MIDKLLTEKYRPKTFEDIILLPRIREIFKTGIKNNYIFHGLYGSGKTSLAKILVGHYSKDKAYLYLNSSYYTSIDTLRGKVDSFCSNVYMGFDLDEDIKKDDMKYVVLDEFERTSMQYQDALKVYIEEYSAKNVRFIFITNHLNKISDGIKKSRMKPVDFNCTGPEEEKYLKTEIYKRVFNVIAPAENFTIAKEDLISIINRLFPDFRAVINEVDEFRRIGTTSLSTGNTNFKTTKELYNLIFDKSKDAEYVFHFLMNSFGPDKMDVMIHMFETPFIKYAILENKSMLDKMFKVANIITRNMPLLESKTDPIIIGLNVIGEIRDLF